MSISNNQAEECIKRFCSGNAIAFVCISEYSDSWIG